MPKSPEGGYVPSPEENKKAEKVMTPEGREALETDDASVAIAAAAEGKKVVYTASEHYRNYVTFLPGGKVVIEDGDVPAYEHKMGNRSSGTDEYVTDMRYVIEVLKKAIIAVPAGNIESFGGTEKIANDIMTTRQIEQYIKGYEAMTPEQQDDFRNTMSDKRKE